MIMENDKKCGCKDNIYDGSISSIRFVYPLDFDITDDNARVYPIPPLTNDIQEKTIIGKEIKREGIMSFGFKESNDINNKIMAGLRPFSIVDLNRLNDDHFKD